MSSVARFSPASQSAELGADMRAAALDSFIRQGRCSEDALAGYGFPLDQVALHGASAIAQACDLWIREDAA